MYLKSLTYKNVGPLRHVDIDLTFHQDGRPKPLVLVGENGSGKSILLSNVVDALIEAASVAYSNIQPSLAGNRTQYFKAIMPQDIAIGERYMVMHALFDSDDEYIFKSGIVRFEDIKDEIKAVSGSLNWGDEQNYKRSTMDSKNAEKLFEENVVCYFGPNRYEIPSWMGDKYLGYSRSMARITSPERYRNELNNPIIVQRCVEATVNWVLDVIADSRSDLKKTIQNGVPSYSLVHVDASAVDQSMLTRDGVEEILSTILQKDVFLNLRSRVSGVRRLSIHLESTDEMLCPSLDALSTGQLALFELFSTIVRYADSNRINSGSNLSNICGIVVIDEVDLHLHSDLQRVVLPQLIAKFPSVQFVITTHSPLVLLGLSECLGEDGFDLVQLPDGEHIGAESFSEFEKAYSYYSNTVMHQKMLREAITEQIADPLIITEGKTDWRHFKAAQQVLSRQDGYESLFEHGFCFLEDDAIEMGADKLISLCKNLSQFPQTRPIIVLADSDNENANKNLAPLEGALFRRHGNGIYSLVLPVPVFRNERTGVCVEEMYEDDIITTTIECKDGVSRRLFLQSEFDDFGRSDNGYSCPDIVKRNAKNSSIIDGGNAHVVKSNDLSDGTNYALPKIAFANYMLDNALNFNDGRFESFVPIFEGVQQAIEDWIATKHV